VRRSDDHFPSQRETHQQMATIVSPAELLNAWERGYGRSLVEQGLQLLALALPGGDRASLESISIGERNRLLLLLRARLFGSLISCIDRCPQCATHLEIEFSLGSLMDDRPPIARQISATWSSHRISVRLPTSRDLCAIQNVPEGASRQRALLQQCLLSNDSIPPPDAWPQELVEKVAVKLAAADPGCDTALPLSCGNCGKSWHRRFDIVSYLWAEIDRHAQRLVSEIARIATAYGWSENDILALSDWRRRLYLDLARA